MNSKIDLSRQMCHNIYRNFQHRNARRRSRGVVLYYKDSIKDGIESIKTHHRSVIWLKLEHVFFKTDNDIYLCGIQLWNEDSPAYDVVNVDFFNILENDINFYEDLGDVYVCGDFNSRIGSKHDFIRNDDVNSFFDNLDYIPDECHSRASFDTKSNNFGTKLLDICKSTGMRIVNGRVGEDQGPFTFISRNGASVVDYLLCKECNFSNIMCFNVNSMN